jgi:hypothetical protein
MSGFQKNQSAEYVFAVLVLWGISLKQRQSIPPSCNPDTIQKTKRTSEARMLHLGLHGRGVDLGLSVLKIFRRR